MRNRIKNVFNSAVSEFSMLAIVCCMVMIAVTMQSNGAWTYVAGSASLIGGIVLFGWLIWLIYVFVKNKTVKEMAMKPRFVVESCSRLLLLYWIYIVTSPILALIWLVLIVWDARRELTMGN